MTPVVTSPQFFEVATPTDEAVAFLDALLAWPGMQLAPLGPEGSTRLPPC